jgi:CubicO group peptidase (beta-lactamase class C family)
VAAAIASRAHARLGAADPPELAARIAAFEAKLQTMLPPLMAANNTPGASVALAVGGRTVFARGYGVKAAGGGDPVTPETRFQAASISKPVAALSTLALADAGTLDLDAPVNRYLKSWTLPASPLVTDKPVTLRRILSHTAGLGVHGFPGYATDAPLPSVPQILDGVRPANTPAVRSILPPGAKTEYSGGGITIEQLIVTDVTGEAFPERMTRVVLKPLGMDKSGYFQPLPAGLEGQAATAHDAKGVPLKGHWHVYPELAAAGLWTTPSDLLAYVRGVQAAVAGRPGALISQRLARDMVTPQLPGSEPGFGLGPALKGATFGHGGANEGFRCNVTGQIDGDAGWAVMTNGDLGGSLVPEVQRVVADIFQWGS